MRCDKVKIISRCRACESLSLKNFFKFKSLPVAGMYLKESEIKKDASLPLTLVHCKHCGLVQTKEAVSAEIYADYHFIGTFSQCYVEHLCWVCDYLVREKNIKRKKILEIGCGDGYLLWKLKKLGNNEVFGYEPSQRLAEECKKREIPVSRKYFPDEDLLKSGNRYDVIIIRHVLEHIDNLNEFLKAVCMCIHGKSIMVIEVPDVEEIFNKRLYSNIFHQHLNYFSPFSISNLLEKYNFYLIYFKKIEIHGGSIFLIFEKDESKKINVSSSPVTFSDCIAFINSLREYYATIRKLVDECVNQGIKVYGYGAAERTFSVLAMTKLTNREIVKIYDKEQFLHNYYIPTSRIMIESPDNIPHDDVGCLIIFATSYEEEILKELKDKYNFTGKIISIKNGPRIFDIINYENRVV